MLRGMTDTATAPALDLPSSELRALRVERADGIAEVTLLGPGKGNAMGPDMFAELPLVFRALGKDAATRVVVLKGSGGNFSYGLDLFAMSGKLAPLVAGPQGAANRLELLALIDELQLSLDAVARCKKPVIAAVTGHCIGGGLDLIAACDLRVASKSAKFSLREVKVGMVADIGSLQRLPAIVGEGHLREMAYTGKDIDAERALRIGLVNELFDDEAALLAGAKALAKSIADNSPLVVQGIKAVMDDRLATANAENLRKVALWNAAFLPSEDLAEALAAFMERRPPVWKGR
jgi:enoyl-CoA hydratase